MMIKYMNGSIFSKARYMKGVGFKLLARTPIPQLPPCYHICIDIFLISPQKHVVDTHKKGIAEALLVTTHIRKYLLDTPSPVAMSSPY